MKIKFLISITLILWFVYSGNVFGQSGGIWPFDDGADPTEDTLGLTNNEGDVRSGVTFLEIEPLSPAGGSYLNFTGDKNAYVAVNDDDELDITTNLTLEAYIKTSCETDCTQGIF